MRDEAGLAALARGHCPQCGKRGFVWGPKALGGMVSNVNMECADLDCRARFNVAYYADGTPISFQPLPRQGDEGGLPWPTDP